MTRRASAPERALADHDRRPHCPLLPQSPRDGMSTFWRKLTQRPGPVATGARRKDLQIRPTYKERARKRQERELKERREAIAREIAGAIGGRVALLICCDVGATFCALMSAMAKMGLARFTTCAPTPVRRSSTPRHALKTYMRGCRSE